MPARGGGSRWRAVGRRAYAARARREPAGSPPSCRSRSVPATRPPVLPSFLRLVIPPLVLLVTGFGAFHVYVATLSARQGQWPVALFYAVFGVAGLALAVGLWQLRRRALMTPGATPGATSSPAPHPGGAGER